MIIKCVNCDVRYNIDDSRFNTPQKKVKCSKCGEIFVVTKEKDPAESKQAEKLTTESHSESSDQTVGRPPEPPLQIDRKEDTDSSDSSDNNLSVDSQNEQNLQTGFAANGYHQSKEQGTDIFSPPKDPDFEKPESSDDELEIDFEDKKDAFDTKAESDAVDNNQSTENFSGKQTEEVRETVDENFTAGDSGEDAESENVELIDWENLEIDDLQKKVTAEPPKMATESSEEKSDEELDLEENQEYKKEGFKKLPEPEKKEKSPFSSPLTPDFSDNLSDFNRVSAETRTQGSEYSSGSESQNPYIPSSRKKQGFLTRIFISFLYIIVLTIVFTAAVFSLVTFDVIPQEKFTKYVEFASAYLPSAEERDNKKFEDLSVKNLKGKWVNTRNGNMYVVYGEVENKGDKPVNYIKLKSTFHSAGSDLYMQDFYSGNTLTLKELKNESPARLKQKLNRREGDVDLQDISTFAGRNYNIDPGESVPFYTFYLSGKKILGLKYDVVVVDFETGVN